MVATVTKKWNGWLADGVVDADSFVVDFDPLASLPSDDSSTTSSSSRRVLSIEEKALVLSSAFLIDLMYYENGGC